MFGKYTTGDPIIHWGDPNSTLQVGNYCSIGENVHIYLKGGSIVTKDKKWRIPLSHSSVTIGNDIWIGANVTIMPGITICDGATIAPNTCIVNDVKPYSFISGKLGHIISFKFNKKQIKFLLKIKWWHWTDEKIQGCTDLLNGDINTFMRELTSGRPFGSSP
jgi:serine acetyltransferase